MKMVFPSVPVSAVIPCFRCTDTIARAVISVAQQTHKPIELILIDDASGDGTITVLQQLAAEYAGWIKVIEFTDNQGAANARNAGWAIASGTYVAFLDADDVWHPQKIEIQYAYMAAHPEISLSGHAHRQLSNPKASPAWSIGAWSVRSISAFQMLLSNRFVTPSVMLKRELPFRFKAGKRHMEDHLLWSEIVCAGLGVTRLSAELAAIYKFAFGASGLSGEYQKMQRAELENYRLLYQSKRINFGYFAALTLYALLKYCRRLMIIYSRRLSAKQDR